MTTNVFSLTPNPASVPLGSQDKRKLLELATNLSGIRIIYDCGSRDALDGLKLAQSLGAQELHIFECNPPSFEVCRANVERHVPATQVFLNSVAVFNMPGSIDFFPIDTARTVTSHLDGNPGASSMFQASGKYSKERYVQNRISVTAITLEEYAREHRPPDLLWMDLQGAELLALEGCGAMLSQVKLIHLEIGFREIYSGQVLFWELDEFLRSRNFERVWLDLGRWPAWLWLYRLLRTGPWVGNAIYRNCAHA